MSGLSGLGFLGKVQEGLKRGAETLKNDPRAQELGNRFGDMAGKYGDRVIDVGTKLMETGLERADSALESVLPDQQTDQQTRQPTGGAEYSLVDTVVLVFIILAIIMLVYVVLAETGILGKVKSGVYSIMVDDRRSYARHD